jgi:hypothetical protein
MYKNKGGRDLSRLLLLLPLLEMLFFNVILFLLLLLVDALGDCTGKDVSTCGRTDNPYGFMWLLSESAEEPSFLTGLSRISLLLLSLLDKDLGCSFCSCCPSGIPGDA